VSAILLLPLAVALAGGLLYALAGSAKLAELGLVLFAVGVFWLVGLYAHATLHL